MSQPTDQPTSKRADELTVGDYIHDGRGIGPVEVAYTLAHPNQHGEERMLLVTRDAAVSYHLPADTFPLATAAEMVEAEQRRERAAVVARIREMADWVEQHPELPPPTSVRLTMQHSMISGSDEEKLAVAAKVAELLGERPETLPVESATSVYSASVRAAHEVGDYHTGEMRYVVHGFLSVLPSGLDPETPLDELPADFGADHQPQLDADAAADDGQHLAYNAATERYETGGDEIEFADEGAS